MASWRFFFSSALLTITWHLPNLSIGCLLNPFNIFHYLPNLSKHSFVAEVDHPGCALLVSWSHCSPPWALSRHERTPPAPCAWSPGLSKLVSGRLGCVVWWFLNTTYHHMLVVSCNAIVMPWISMNHLVVSYLILVLVHTWTGAHLCTLVEALLQFAALTRSPMLLILHVALFSTLRFAGKVWVVDWTYAREIVGGWARIHVYEIWSSNVSNKSAQTYQSVWQVCPNSHWHDVKVATCGNGVKSKSRRFKVRQFWALTWETVQPCSARSSIILALALSAEKMPSRTMLSWPKGPSFSLSETMMPPSTKTFCFLRKTQRNMTSFLSVHLVVKGPLPISGVNRPMRIIEQSAALATRGLTTCGPTNLPSAEHISAKINGHGQNR